jgi:hypothetical protein
VSCPQTAQSTTATAQTDGDAAAAAPRLAGKRLQAEQPAVLGDVHPRKEVILAKPNDWYQRGTGLERQLNKALPAKQKQQQQQQQQPPVARVRLSLLMLSRHIVQASHPAGPWPCKVIGLWDLEMAAGRKSAETVPCHRGSFLVLSSLLGASSPPYLRLSTRSQQPRSVCIASAAPPSTMAMARPGFDSSRRQ